MNVSIVVGVADRMQRGAASEDAEEADAPDRIVAASQSAEYVRPDQLSAEASSD